MAKSQHRQIITLKSSASSHTYTSMKNKNNTKDRLEIKKYDPVVKKHVNYKEEKK